MMKKLKQFGALMLALVLAVALCCPALAAGEKGSITINNAVEGKTYTVYRILDVTYNETTKSVAYTVNSAWTDFFAENAEGTKYLAVENGNVSWKTSVEKNEANRKALADAAMNFVNSHNNIQGITAKAAAKQDDSEAFVATFTNLDLGYYLVKSDVGALCALTTTDKNATVNEKNDLPTIDKQVKEGENYGKTNDANIGDTVEFKTTITAAAGNTTGYVLHDKMSNGLTFNADSVKVAIGNTNWTQGTDYTLTTNKSDGCTFEIEFKKEIASTDVITVTYSATLNGNAVVAGDGNINETHLKYDNGTTVDSTTRTYTWEMDVFKYYRDGESKSFLGGAKFVLYKQEDGKMLYATLNDEKISWNENKDQATVFESSSTDGMIKISGLDADTYYLEETEAPAGYNKLGKAITVEIRSTDTDGAKTSGLYVNNDQASRVEVENKTGSTLPTTGGMGTTVLYVVGGVLVVCAGVALVAKKRMQ